MKHSYYYNLYPIMIYTLLYIITKEIIQSINEKIIYF